MAEGEEDLQEITTLWINTLERNDSDAMTSQDMVTRLPTLVERFNQKIGPLYATVTTNHKMATYSLPAVDVIVGVELMKWFEGGLQHEPAKAPTTAIAYTVYRTVLTSRYFRLINNDKVQETLRAIKLELGGRQADCGETHTSLVCAIIIPYLLNRDYGQQWGNYYLDRACWKALVKDLLEAPLPTTATDFRARGQALKAWELHVRGLPTALHPQGATRTTTKLVVSTMLRVMQGIQLVDEWVVTAVPSVQRPRIDTLQISAYASSIVIARERKEAMGEELRRQYRLLYPALPLPTSLINVPYIPPPSKRSKRRNKASTAVTGAGRQPVSEGEGAAAVEGAASPVTAATADTAATPQEDVAEEGSSLGAVQTAGESTSEGVHATITDEDEIEEAARSAVRHVREQMRETTAALLTALPPTATTVLLGCSEKMDGPSTDAPEPSDLTSQANKRTHHQAFEQGPDEMVPGRISPLYLAMQRYGRPMRPDDALSMPDYRAILTRLLADCTGKEEEGRTTASSKR